jgi:hypothetical protein
MSFTRPHLARFAPLAAVLLAACGGSDVNQVPAASPAPALPSTGAVATAATTAPAAPPDPALPFRLAYADPGGMWMPQQMTLPQHASNFKNMGVTLDAEKLSDPLASPLAAVVSLGGCTGSFVSPEGLIVTNHHCVQSALQRNSDEKHNLVEDGFLAKTKADEKAAGPAQRVMVAQAFKDVTRDMRDGLDAIKDPIARKEALEKRSKQLIAACEKDRPEIRCSVSKFFRGGQYELIEMLEIKDVRLVYAPARSVGDYGGEVDNWEWPRHTGDWSFYRAYVGKDGKPADPSPDNVPYQPKNWLKVSTAGLRPGDFVMVTGYPGRTQRGETASETHNDLDWYYPYVTAYLDERYKVAEAHVQDAGETGIKATTTKQGIQNGLEKYQGIVQGFQKHPDLLQQKDTLDAQTKAWAAQAGHERYKKDIDRLEAILTDARKTQRVDFDRNAAFGGSRLLGTALSLTRWADERAKKDEDRKPGYQARDLDRATAGQKQFARSFDRTLDRAELRLALVHALQLPEAQRPWLAKLLGSKPGQKVDEKLIDATLDAWYAAPLLEDAKLRLDLLTNGTMKDLKASKDPFVAAALRIWPTVKAEEKKADARTGELILVEPSYVEAMKQTLGGAVAPDANSTLRITYGTVRSLHPEAHDLENGPFTVASQILAKDTGKDPFNAPSKLLEAIKAKDFGPYADPALGGDLPIDFEADMDITGGNSGSPTLNSKGELVGLAFDGNKEGIASDVVFDPQTTRSIHVDARYMIWTMDKLDDAKHLIKEMGLTPKM